MENEIKVPSFVNYTDLREKKELPQIEVEQIKNYAKSLGTEQMQIFLAEVTDEELVAALHIRLIQRKSKIENIARYL